MENISEFSNAPSPDETFLKWFDLPPELKILVVSHLDYRTRTRLSLCSKTDYEIVNSTQIQIDSFSIRDNGEEEGYIHMHDIVSVSVRIGFGNKDNQLHVHFVQQESDTDMVYWTNPTEGEAKIKSTKLEGRNYYEEAVNLAEKWLKMSKYSPKSLLVEMENYPIEKSEIQYFERCDSIIICHDDEETLKWWLERIPPNLSFFQIWSNSFSINNPFSTNFLSADHFKMCQALYIYRACGFTYEQFLGLTARVIDIVSNTQTDQEINGFIRKWVNGEVRDNFVMFTINKTRNVNKDEILKNITFRRWDNEFFENEDSCEFAHFWRDRKRNADCYQIIRTNGLGMSATLDIAQHRIIFCVTGKRIEQNGRISTSYRMPDEASDFSG